MEMSKLNEENEKYNCQENYQNVDYQILEKYSEKNKHFYFNQILYNNDQQIIGYEFVYRYENYQVKLEFYLSDGIWDIDAQQFNRKQQQILKILLDDMDNTTNMSLEQQIQIIIQRFDHHFYELNENKLKISSMSKEEDDDEINFNPRANLVLENTLSTPSTILEVDEEQNDSPIQLLTSDGHLSFDCLTPPITPTKTRQDSSCSSTNSIRYTQFVPPLMLSIGRRRVIQSIRLGVHRKKKAFETLVGTLKHSPKEPTMYQLGLEFLRIYDGKFNYPIGHTFVVSFEKRTWFLTIDYIKCIECEFGQSEPRSVLILKYKNKFTTVQL